MNNVNLTSIDDFCNQDIENVLDLALEIEKNPKVFHGLAAHRIVSNLFFEPSTRTRGSFEAAIKRLGGDAITASDIESSSIVKGESLADTIRIWSGYSDLIVLRHPWEGAAHLASQYSDVPVINAGDGGHEHPTQTLCDLYTLWKEFGTINGIRIILCGDLKNGRTVHSLIYALIRFGASIVFVPGKGLELPSHVVNKIERELATPIQKISDPGLELLYGQSINPSVGDFDAINITPSSNTRPLFDSIQFNPSRHDAIAFYVTRRQVEREPSVDESQPDYYPRINSAFLDHEAYSKAVILHPLPRVDEISPDIDSDSRSRYFQQARNGVPVRMALISLMLGLKGWENEAPATELNNHKLTSAPTGIVCTNQQCVSYQEPQSCHNGFTFFVKPTIRFVCGYCDREIIPNFYAEKGSNSYCSTTGVLDELFDPDSCLFFNDESEAIAAGYQRFEGKLNYENEATK